MMKHKRADIDLLLGALLLFSAVLGLFHSTILTAAQQASDNAIADVSLEESLAQLQPAIVTKSVERLVDTMRGATIRKAIHLLESILSNEQLLIDRSDRVELLLGVAQHYQKDEDKFRIYDLILDQRYPMMREGEPILYIAAVSSYPQNIPLIKKWYAKKIAGQNNRADLNRKLESNALLEAVKKNDIDALRAMKLYGVEMDKKRMSQLLHQAVSLKADRKIIHFILDQGADINHAIDGYTPLMRAVKNNDMGMVQLLVERGAEVNKLVDPAVGNAVQIAVANEFVDIETFLRDEGGQY